MKKHILFICLIDCFLFLRKFVKDNAKIGAMIGSLAVAGYFVDSARGGELKTFNYSNQVTYKINGVKTEHIEGATEGYDNNGMDSLNPYPSSRPFFPL